MRALVFLLMVSLFPGAAEALGDFGHAVVNGHNPHDHQQASASHHEDEDEHEGHRHEGPALVPAVVADAQLNLPDETGGDQSPAHQEHHCTALFHLCGCHVPAPTTTTTRVVMATTTWAELPQRVSAIVSDLSIRPADGARSASLRPPIA